MCTVGKFGTQLSRQATQNAMLWAHAAGCPCDSWLHRAAGRRLVIKRSSTSKSSSGTSSSSSRRNDAGGDVGRDVATNSRWNAVLFSQVFADRGGVVVVLALLLLAAALALVVQLAAAALPLPIVRSPQQQVEHLASVVRMQHRQIESSATMRTSTQQGPQMSLVDAAAGAINEVSPPAVVAAIAAAAAAAAAAEKRFVLKPLPVLQTEPLPAATLAQLQLVVYSSSTTEADAEL
jgi:hypothetical protein